MKVLLDLLDHVFHQVKDSIQTLKQENHVLVARNASLESDLKRVRARLESIGCDPMEGE